MRPAEELEKVADWMLPGFMSPKALKKHACVKDMEQLILPKLNSNLEWLPYRTFFMSFLPEIQPAGDGNDLNDPACHILQLSYCTFPACSTLAANGTCLCSSDLIMLVGVGCNIKLADVT